MNVRANGPALLQENVGVLKSRMGTFYPGSHVIYRGHDLHKDLKDMDWVELYVFGITGRRFTQGAVAAVAFHLDLHQLPGCPPVEQPGGGIGRQFPQHRDFGSGSRPGGF